MKDKIFIIVWAFNMTLIYFILNFIKDHKKIISYGLINNLIAWSILFFAFTGICFILKFLKDLMSRGVNDDNY